MRSLVVFALGDARFALASEDVQEIAAAVAIAPLPNAPAIVEGVINVRGAIVPVLDLRRRFGLDGRALTPDQHLLVARAGTRQVALRVDRVCDVIAVSEGDLGPLRPPIPGTDHLAGIARLADGLVVVADLALFLALGEAERLDSALTQRDDRS
jgi:purine-binding chemotaxis protein CheW